MNLWELSATELAEGYSRRAFSPREALDAVLARLEEVNPKINAVVTLDLAGARAAADASSTRWRDGKALGACDGVPLTVKDNIPVRGMRATWGTRIYADWIPEKDELPIAKLRAGGAVIFGKTNCSEFTLQGFTDNPVFGLTRNPWNLEVTPGGSSGGAVAAVAAAIGPVAIGTDGGGSIRRPSAHTGVVGLKPSRDVVARADGFPVILLDCEVIGPITRTVSDARALFHALAGTSSPAPPSPRALRIFYIGQFGDAPVDPEITANVAAAANDFAGLGHRVEAGRAPFDIDELNRAWSLVGQVGLAWLMREYVDRLSEISPAMQEMVRNGAQASATAYYDAIDTIIRLRATIFSFFAEHDVILTPSIAALSWPITEMFPPIIDGRPAGSRGHAVFTAFANMAGCPAINIPCQPSRSGLPIGFQLVGSDRQDEMLLALAAQYERAHPWARRAPI
jgi:aspartyl-tRNA(Asn)/glutamyl-tRNA(Gln) amidotransferase subunit A